MVSSLYWVVKYHEWLDGTHGPIEMLGETYPLSLMLPRIDPVKYDKMYAKWCEDNDQPRLHIIKKKEDDND